MPFSSTWRWEAPVPSLLGGLQTHSAQQPKTHRLPPTKPPLLRSGRNNCLSLLIFLSSLPPPSRYNEFYFLTHPALFVNNHFPDNSNWQLLKPTLTLKQFESNLQHNSDFYNLGLLAAHPQTALIQTGNPLSCQYLQRKIRSTAVHPW